MAAATAYPAALPPPPGTEDWPGGPSLLVAADLSGLISAAPPGLAPGHDGLGCDGQGRDGQGCEGQGHDGQGHDGQGQDGQGQDGQGQDGQGQDGQGHDGQGQDGQGHDGLGCDGQGQDGLGCDGLGCDGLGCDGLGCGVLDALLGGSPQELPGDEEQPAAGPVCREVLKAGRWDRSCGDGAGFACGGVADRLPPGATLAGLTGDMWERGLARVSDDELIGVLRAARRLGSWAGAMELAAAADLWRRRIADDDAGEAGAAAGTGDEIAAALTLTGRSADGLLDLAVSLRRLPATSAALAAGDIDVPRAAVIVQELTGLADEHAAAVEAAVISAAPRQSTGQLRRAAHRAVLAADPAAARRRKQQAEREARVERWSEPAGTAALAGRDLPPAGVLAADANLTALATQLKAAGVLGTMDTLRARIYLALLTGAPVTSLLPNAPATSPWPPASPATSPCPPASNPCPPDSPVSSPGDSPGGTGGGSPGGGGNPGAGKPADHGRPGSPDGSPGSTGGGSPGSGGGGSPGGGGNPGAGKPADHSRPDSQPRPCVGSPAGDRDPHGSADDPVDRFGFGSASPGLSGRVNLTVPLATWLGHSDAPGHVPGYGPLDATDSRAVADALATRADSTWCLTLTDTQGIPVAHGCARPRPASGKRRAPPAARSPDGPPGASATAPPAGTSAVTPPPPRTRAPAPPQGTSATAPPAGTRGTAPPAGTRGTAPPPGTGPATPPAGSSAATPPAGTGAAAPPASWTFTISLLEQGRCSHARQTAGYRPSPALRHVIELRQATCTFPGCSRPATQCDQDHTVPYHLGGRTCECNLAPLCRRHHQVKQARGWTLEQTSPGIMTWTTPAGRRYITTPTRYAS